MGACPPVRQMGIRRGYELVAAGREGGLPLNIPRIHMLHLHTLLTLSFLLPAHIVIVTLPPRTR